MRTLSFFALAAGLFAADQVPPVGTTWKLGSEKVLEGNPPAFALAGEPGKLWTVPPVNTNPSRSAPRRKPAVVVKFTVSPDGQVLTWEGHGTDEKGKMFRFVQTWEKQ